MSAKPSVLFVCVHNAGRSQMAAALLAQLSDGQIEVRSAGTAPADAINPVAVAAMAELGIDITAEQPKVLTTEAVQDSDVVITMGCGDACPIFPGKRYEDWKLDDPAGQGIPGCLFNNRAVRHGVREGNSYFNNIRAGFVNAGQVGPERILVRKSGGDKRNNGASAKGMGPFHGFL